MCEISSAELSHWWLMLIHFVHGGFLALIPKINFFEWKKLLPYFYFCCFPSQTHESNKFMKIFSCVWVKWKQNVIMRQIMNGANYCMLKFEFPKLPTRACSWLCSHFSNRNKTVTWKTKLNCKCHWTCPFWGRLFILLLLNQMRNN